MMKSATALGRYPAARPLTGEQVTEYHASRLLLLLYLSNRNHRVDGLTKLAKLDFFVRYPDFFARAAEHLGHGGQRACTGSVDSAMVRYRYGPWDPRYYQVLGFLEGRALITVAKKKKAFVFTLTDEGGRLAKKLIQSDVFRELTAHITSVKTVLGGKTGDAIKRLVYELFDEEVARLPLGEAIRP